ncbi:uncharacterized protein ARMOST_06831 [Armillaria ostoyae]|uniref:Uncharacterized protein n=1 Tax=Armillaria ostoyae TaxID=47428 RepID=A0A284R469_ARMOS|nr:uncharacterized protein ARMOST_06831 [Armillaria ostoyae]
MTTLPPELVEIIVYEAWHSEMPSYVRKRLMTACPSINRTWKAVYAPIASQDMYITNLAFLDYLCRIVAQFRKSIIYRDFIPRLTRTITCFVDLRACEREGAAEEVYLYLNVLRNMRGFEALFPHVPHLSLLLPTPSSSMTMPIYRPLLYVTAVCYRCVFAFWMFRRVRFVWFRRVRCSVLLMFLVLPLCVTAVCYHCVFAFFGIVGYRPPLSGLARRPIGVFLTGCVFLFAY